MQEKEITKIKDLFKDALRLHQVSIPRNYIQTIKENARNKESDLKEWLQWANDEINWFDPLVGKEDPLLDEKHKTSVFKDFLSQWQESRTSSYLGGWN